MMQIPVGTKHTASVDDEDFPMLSRYKWRLERSDQTNYANTCIAGESVGMERLVTGDFESYCIDHKDSDGLNNTKANLRPANRGENASNRKDQKKPKGLFFGVKKQGKGFAVHVSLFGQRVSIGTFPNATRAAYAYDAVTYLAKGEFATLNFPHDVGNALLTLKERVAKVKRDHVLETIARLGSKRAAARVLEMSESAIYRL